MKAALLRWPGTLFRRPAGPPVTIRPGAQGSSCVHAFQCEGRVPANSALLSARLTKSHAHTAIYQSMAGVPKGRSDLKNGTKKAKYPAIDCHHHAQSRTPEQVEEEVRIMDAAGVGASVVFPPVGEGPSYRGSAFDNVCQIYSKYRKRFYIYCGLDLRGVDQPGFGAATIAELERCHKVGALSALENSTTKAWASGVSWAVGQPARLRPILVLSAAEQVQRRFGERLQLASGPQARHHGA